MAGGHYGGGSAGLKGIGASLRDKYSGGGGGLGRSSGVGVGVGDSALGSSGSSGGVSFAGDRGRSRTNSGKCRSGEQARKAKSEKATSSSSSRDVYSGGGMDASATNKAKMIERMIEE